MRDDRRFYRALGRMVWTTGRVLARYGVTAGAYRRRYPELVNDGHWHRQLGTGPGGQRPVVGAAAGRTSAESG